MIIPVHKISSAEVFKDDVRFPLSVQRHENHSAGLVHSHEFHELVVLMGGAGTHITDRGDYALRAGDVFLVRGTMAHGYTDTQYMKLINILFQPQKLGLPLQHLNDLPGYHALFRIEPKMRAADRFRQRLTLSDAQLTIAARHIAMLEAELQGRKPGYRFSACLHLMNLLAFLSHCYDGTRHPKQRQLMRLGEVLSFMESQLENKMSVAELADMAGMSESTLTRRFRDVLGRSPVEHLMRLRIDRARELLQNPDLNITEVALACGFTDSNYFSRCFKATTGYSPKGFRELKTEN